MSYTVEYNPELRKTYPLQKRKLQKLSMKPIAITVILFASLYAGYKAEIFRWLLPGDTAVTAGAFSSMVREVRSGQSVSDAVFSFFKNVIAGGVQ